ncbi:TRAF3-interacting protein 1 isoform X2 [Scleropages formosus]|uniref:TRAF3-interacting protein 1 isoform X2 n=1 Tax=Scleropages formosus TaxID=113540 RepID=UPI0010FAA225|nr:TRAF3-interacting protein 1-like isoform X2 [Scleropages formosus]
MFPSLKIRKGSIHSVRSPCSRTCFAATVVTDTKFYSVPLQVSSFLRCNTEDPSRDLKSQHFLKAGGSMRSCFFVISPVCELQVIRTTGFMKGLYTETEMKSENVKDKEAKMLFLQKAIDVVMLTSGEPLSTKPARIAAGHEPEKTNELLQAIGRCCLNKLSSDEAVKRVLAGDRPDPRGKPSSQDKENREGRDRNQAREERKEVKERSTSRDAKDSDPRHLARDRDREDRRTKKDRHRDSDRSKDRDRDRNQTKDRDPSKDRDRDRNQTKYHDQSKDRDRDHNRANDRDHTKDRVRDHRKEENESKSREKEKNGRRRRCRDDELERREEEEEEEEEEDRTGEPERETAKGRKGRGVEDMQNESPLDRVIRNKPADQEYVEALSPARLPRPTSAKGQRQRAQPGAQDGSDGEGGAEIPSAAKQTHEGTQDAAEALRPQTSQRRIPRPSSARPAPPRVKRQESYTEPVLPERLGSSKLSAAVIVEGAGLSDQEDDEQFVVEESAAPHLDVPRPETEPAVVVQDDGSHGGLVKKILETKKDYERAPLSSALNDQAERQSPLSEARWKECDLLSREMDRLSASVQAVCRSTVPLGRIVNYLQEDVDSMQVELQAWRRENQEYVQALLQEQRVTESTVEPLRAELSQLEQLIRDQRDKICTIKSSILLNEAKIQKMVSVTTSSSHS